MSEHETVADIIREKREMAAEIRAHLSIVPARREEQLLEADSLDREADRIEAAAKREHLSRRAIKVPIEVEVLQTGNAAAMRDIVTALANVILPPRGKADEDGWLAWVRAMQEKARAALSKPPRQCDVGTPEEQTRRMFEQYCSEQISCYELPSGEHCPLHCKGVDCRLAWAQMPYTAEEGGAK